LPLVTTTPAASRPASACS